MYWGYAATSETCQYSAGSCAKCEYGNEAQPYFEIDVISSPSPHCRPPIPKSSSHLYSESAGQRGCSAFHQILPAVGGIEELALVDDEVCPIQRVFVVIENKEMISIRKNPHG